MGRNPHLQNKVTSLQRASPKYHQNRRKLPAKKSRETYVFSAVLPCQVCVGPRQENTQGH